MFSLPWYFITLSLIIGLAYSLILYFRDKHFSPWVRRGLAALRFITVSAIALLLFSPIAKSVQHQEERPIIVVAQDNSQSVILGKDSTFYRTQYGQKMERLVEALSDDYEVERYTFDKETTPNGEARYDGASSNISNALQQIADQYTHRNIGAVILATDGIYNEGTNPISSAQGVTYPIYTIGLGDTTTYADAAIVNVRCNHSVFIGDQYPVEITFRARKMRGKNATLSVYCRGRQLMAQHIEYTSDDYSATIPLQVQAEEAGLQQLSISLSADEREYNTDNNHRTVTVEVIDTRQKIVIVAAAPHPDVAALRQALESNRNYDVSVVMASEAGKTSAKVEASQLVIFHNLPNAQYADIVDRMPTRQQIFILGPGCDIARFNVLHTGVEIHTRIDKYDDASAAFNASFSHFTLESGTAHAIEQLPPLSSPFGDYQLSPTVQTLLYAKIGNIASTRPLIAMTTQGRSRRAFIFGNGLWRWRLFDYHLNNTHDNFNSLISKIATFASTTDIDNQFRIIAQKNYRQQETIVLEGELYDNNYNLTNTPEPPVITVSPQNEGKTSNSLTATFARSSAHPTYTLNMGTLSPGTYRYQATIDYDNSKLNSAGMFTVEDFNLEKLNLTADHTLLRTLSHNTTGAFVLPGQMEELPKMLKKRDDLKNVIYTQTRYRQLTDMPLLLVLLVLLLSGEWAARKLLKQ